MDGIPSSITRRDFLQRSALLAGGGLAAPFFAPGVPPVAYGEPSAAALAPYNGALAPHIGVLAPVSSLEPQISEQFVAGLRLGFERTAARPVELEILQAGAGPAAAYEALRTLIAGGIRLVVWLSDSPLSGEIRRLLEESRSVLVQCGAGANLTRDEETSPAVFHHSLGFWQAAWGAGRWAGEKLGKRAWLFSSLYDSGFDTLYSFQLGLESAGGSPAGTSITHRPGAELQNEIQRFQAAEVDFAAAFYCGAAALEFRRAWEAAAPRVPLLGGAGPGDRGWLAPQTRRDDSQPPAAAFPRDLNLEDFALLGCESAALLEAALSALERGQAADLHAALTCARVESPRGSLRLQSGARPGGGRWQITHAGETWELPSPLAADPAIAALRAGLKTGWTHAYLFI